MPRNSRKSFTEPNPLYVLAGAGDLAVEKLRELSRMASDTIGSLESADPVAVSDRVQQTIEARADAIARTIRIHNGVSGGPDDPIQESIIRVFREMGLDGDDPWPATAPT